MEKISETLKAMNLNIKGDVLLNSNINTYLSLHTPETSPLEFGGHDTLQKSLPEIGALNEIVKYFILSFLYLFFNYFYIIKNLSSIITFFQYDIYYYFYS